MANVFGILTAIILAISAFVALKNKAAYETRITETINQKDLLVKSEVRLADRKATLAALPVERAAVDAEVEKLTAAEAAQKKVNEDLTSQVTTKTPKFTANKQQLDDIRVKTEKIGDLKELSSKMRATNAELAELSVSLEAGKSKLDTLIAQNSSTEAQVNSTKAKFENFANGQSLPTLKTRIRSIYPNWGFVTLASGNNAGVVANSTLNVVRGGETIARLLVTAVESSSASASIVPDSLAPDATLMVGDRVEPGLKSTTPAAN